jgi:hypothetical protein
MADDYTHRSRTQLAGLAGAGLLVLVLIVGGGLLVGRAVLAGTTPTTPHPDPDPAQALDTGEVELMAGVPWGFALDPAGAVAAGSAVITVTGQAEFAFDPDRFAAAAEVMFTPEEARIQVRQVEAARTNFEVSGWAEQPASRRMYHLSVLAIRLTAFDPEAVTATVEVWAMTLVGVGDTGGAVFTTSTVDLAADETTSTWRVSALDTVEGPVPLVYDTASAPGRTRAVVRDAIPTLPLPLPALEMFGADT